MWTPTSIGGVVVTLTTVGYGDIAPRTAAGQILASIIMLYGMLVVPTGIVSAELVRGARRRSRRRRARRVGGRAMR